MTADIHQPQFAGQLRSLLSGLRMRIRAYVWLQGICLVLAWLGVTFFLFLGVEWFLLRVGVGELPTLPRLLYLAVVVAGTVWIGYRWIARRAFVRLPHKSMAVLIERRFGAFHDSLVTTVEMGERPDHASSFNPNMLAQAGQQAVANAPQVRLREVFRFGPLARGVVGALAVVAAVAALAAWQPEALALAARRLYLLDSAMWPRHARIEMVGIEVSRSALADELAEPPRQVEFRDATVKVAKGSSVTLQVRADAAWPIVPQTCTVSYRTDDGVRGRSDMKRLGSEREGFQHYSYDGKPFRGVLSDVQFDVLGYDHRLRGYRIEVVDSPAVGIVELQCDFPSYLADVESGSWLPRTIELTSSTSLPRGTRIQVLAQTNKELAEVTVRDPVSGAAYEATIVTPDDETPPGFGFTIESLDESLALQITLRDTDDVESERPYKLFLGAVGDEPPRVDAALRGIGTAITPNVRIPASGRITDDYRVASAWFEVQAAEEPPRQFAFDVGADGTFDAAVDFRGLRANGENPLSLAEGQKLVLTLVAHDRCDLDGAPNEGRGDTFTLDVVSSEQLLAMLEAREAGLRRRFEQIVQEITEARDSLARVQREVQDLSTPSDADEPADATPSFGDNANGVGDADPTGEGSGGTNSVGPRSDAGREPDDEPVDPQQAALRARSLRLLRVQQAMLQSQKSSQEVLGVAANFADIRQELINNRVDTEDRKNRLQYDIVDPLTQVGEEEFPELDRLLKELEAALDDATAAGPAADAAVAQANKILTDLDRVLQRLLKFETYKELLDIVRSLIDDQEKLIEESKVEQRQAARRLLEE